MYRQQSENEKRNYEMGIHERSKYEEEGKTIMETLKSELTQLQEELDQLKTNLPSMKENKENMEKLEKEEEKNIMSSSEWTEKHNELIKKLKISEMTIEQLQEVVIELGKKYLAGREIQEISKKILNDNESVVEDIVFDDYYPPNKYTKPEAEEARNKLQESEKRITDLENAINEKNNNLKIKGIEDNDDDYAWHYIKGKCYGGRSGKYNYNHCLLDFVQQDGTNLGSYDHMEEVDDKKKKILYYKNGSSCWNGPNRSCKVTLECGSENRVIDVSEPSTCVYEMKFQSPLGCTPGKPVYFILFFIQ